MAQFIVRVELHGAAPDADSRLHQRMQALGFIRTLVGDRNVEYYLPAGEYLYVGNMTPENLLNQLVPHVSVIDPQHGIVVTEYQSQKLWFTGLRPVVSDSP